MEKKTGDGKYMANKLHSVITVHLFTVNIYIHQLDATLFKNFIKPDICFGSYRAIFRCLLSSKLRILKRTKIIC
jgi:hypothetical protein